MTSGNSGKIYFLVNRVTKKFRAIKATFPLLFTEKWTSFGFPLILSDFNESF